MLEDVVLGIEELLGLGDSDIHLEPVASSRVSDAAGFDALAAEPLDGFVGGLFGGSEEVGDPLRRPMPSCTTSAGNSEAPAD